MLCCCRQQLDITDDYDNQPPTAKQPPADLDKEKAFSEAVTAHPSPANSPVTQQQPAAHAGQGEPSHPPPHQPAQVAVVKPLEKPKTVEASPVKAPSKPSPEKTAVQQTRASPERSPVAQETFQQSAVEPVRSSPARGGGSGGDSKHVSVINVTGAGGRKDAGSAAARKSDIAFSSSSPKDADFLSQIDSLSTEVERAAAEGKIKSRASCGPYAAHLSDLTSRVRKSASEMSDSALQSAVSRLEAVASRLESIAMRGPGGSSAAGDSGVVAEFVTAFDGFVAGTFAQCMSLASQIGGDVKTQMDMVNEAFKAERQFLVMASKSKQPSQADLPKVMQPVASRMQAIQEFRENNRRSNQFNHLSAISESIAALGWIAVTPAPGPYVKEMKDAAMFYTNRVLKDFKDSDAKQAEWAKSWITTLTELQDYVKQYHTTGVSWNPQGGNASSAGPAPAPAAAGKAPPPPPPGGPPPPPPPPPPADAPGGGSDSRAALFAELNRGEGVTTGLKKVTDDMKTHKNPGLRQGPAPFKATAQKPVAAPKPGAKPTVKAVKPPLTELQNKKWVIEYHEGNKNILLDHTDLKQSVYIYKCNNSVIQVKGKVNSIILDQCKKTAIVLEGVVASLEFVNCQSMQGQVTGKVPTVSIDKTDGCMVYLSKDALDVEIVTAKSSEMNILVPQGDGDYKEFALPEQFKTTWNAEKKTMVTTQTDSV